MSLVNITGILWRDRSIPWRFPMEWRWSWVHGRDRCWCRLSLLSNERLKEVPEYIGRARDLDRWGEECTSPQSTPPIDKRQYYITM